MEHNDSSDGEMEDYIPYWQRPETYFVPVVFALIFIVGVVGNGTLMLIFIRHPNMRNVPNIYIFSLALGDLLVIVSSVPFISVIYTIESWPWGESICKLSECTKDISIGVSVFTLTALSVERYCTIVKPMRRHMSTKPLAIMIAFLIWVVSFIFSLPAIIYAEVKSFKLVNKKDTLVCYPFLDEDFAKVLVMFRFLAYYAIPILVIGIFDTLMARHLLLSTRSLPGEHGLGQSTQIQARKKVAVMVLAFVIIFIICFFPVHLFMLWFHFYPNAKHDFNEFWNYFRIVGFCLGFINSCVNPIALYFFSKAFRKYFDYYLVCCSGQSLHESNLAYVNSSISRRHNSLLMTSLTSASQEKS